MRPLVDKLLRLLPPFNLIAPVAHAIKKYIYDGIRAHIHTIIQNEWPFHINI